MPCVVAAGSWAPSRPVTKRDSSARRSHLRQPGHAHLPCVTADSPRDGCIFGGWRQFLTPGCWLLTGTGSGVPPLEDTAPQRLQPSRRSWSRGPRPCCRGSQAPSTDGLEPTLEGDRKAQSPPRGKPEEDTGCPWPPARGCSYDQGRAASHAAGRGRLSLHILTSLVKFILWNSGRA